MTNDLTENNKLAVCSNSSRTSLVKDNKESISLFLMALPLILMVLAFYYLPLLGWIYSFFDYIPGRSIFEMKFTAFKHFLKMYENKDEFMLVMRNTLVLSFLGIICSPVPVIFAIMLSEVRSRRFGKIVQTLSSIPNFISWILVYSILFTFFSQDGLMNSVLMAMGKSDESINVLGNESIAWFLQTAIAMWKTLGWNAIIYIAAITGIDTEQYDAADVDGAGRWQKIVHITIPGIIPTFVVLLLLQVGGMLNNGFEQYYVFQNPMVREKIEVLDTYVYRVGIQQVDYAYATAVGMFKSIISIILLFSVNWIAKRTRNQSII